MRWLLSLVVVVWGAIASGGALLGTGLAVDGDTLLVGRERVRLFGIDAPERGQTCTDATGQNWACGRVAADQLRDLLAGQSVTCAGRERDRFGRMVARCRVGQVDLGAALVAAGLAVAYRRYALDYVAAEQSAAQARRGVWQGDFMQPADFRRGQGAGSGACDIKGNISASGRLYHLPGQRLYDATRIDGARGERWFCSEAEALAAGWRRALR